MANQVVDDCGPADPGMIERPDAQVEWETESRRVRPPLRLYSGWPSPRVWVGDHLRTGLGARPICVVCYHRIVRKILPAFFMDGSLLVSPMMQKKEAELLEACAPRGLYFSRGVPSRGVQFFRSETWTSTKPFPT